MKTPRDKVAVVTGGGSEPAEVTREELHFRRIDMRGWRRSDGLFEIEGRVVDRKPFEFRPPSGPRVVGADKPVHDLGVRLVFDADRVIREVHTFSAAYPYEECPGGGASLQALVGLRIGAGWSSEVRKRLPPSETCTHLRELLLPLASAAFQSLAPFGDHNAVDAEGRSPLINSCYAYGDSRKIVLQRWPAFHRPEAGEAAPGPKKEHP
ncbi:MAG TPA: DUF2889 domain-containing protein [Ramlibacter sp.]|nr:DUF2889 domain-containing protein [Ramlibacter sp.]